MTQIRSAPPAEAARRRLVPPLLAALRAVGLPILGVLIALGAWWLTTSLQLIHPLVLPPPDEVWAEFGKSADRLLEHAAVTTQEVVLGFLLSAAFGTLIGLGLAASHVLERMFMPLLVAVNAVPKITIGPLLVVAMGWGQTPILTMVFLLCFFPIVLATATGLAGTPADLAELARSLDASRWQTFRKVRLPAAVPQIFVGLKVGMPLAAIGAVIGEFQAGEGGLGYLIQAAAGVGQSTLVWAAILLIGIISIVLYFLLVVVERLALPWVRETTSAR